MSIPLVVDLDGTLILTDMLHESALKVLRESPLTTLSIPFWLRRGRAVVKQQLARRSEFDTATLPYNQEFIAWLKQQKATGRRLILCTASDEQIAREIAGHIQLFDEVMASNGETNLSGPHKAEALEKRFGDQGFDYAGNSHKDLAVWSKARRAVLVNASTGVASKAHASFDIEQEFPGPDTDHSSTLVSWLKMIRVHQWLKSLLLFIPLIAAHQFADGAAWLTVLVAFLAFCFCASAVYITNDLLDLESDRLHPRKRLRPLASGDIPAWQGVILIPVLLLASLLLALVVGNQFLQWLLLYFLLTCAYSFGLKRLILVDCLTLAMLYTLRIIAGAAAGGIDITFWLLAESVFLFLSLAFVKRYTELRLQSNNDEARIHGRGYYTSDAPLIQSLGITSGYMAVLVLALYLNSETVLELYPTPVFVWIAMPIMLFWISWMWIQAVRGNMHDEPLVFAVMNKASLAAGACFFLALLMGSLDWPW